MPRRTRAHLVALTAACSVLAGCSTPEDRQAMGSEQLVPPLVVSLGDSYISGEAGRWMGNSNGFTNLGGDVNAARRTDRGRSVYFDAGRSEAIAGCHRADSAEVHVGQGWTSVNLACSGATTATRDPDSDGHFKPGIDEAGQLGLLAELAGGPERIGVIVLSIGGNDVGFGPVVAQCAKGFITSTRLNKDLCRDNASVTARFTPESLANVQADVASSIEAVVRAMRDSGYSDDEWALVVQNYPDPLAPSNAIRYGTLTRQAFGGCPLWNEDLDWVHDEVLPALNAMVSGAVVDAEGAVGKDILTLDVTGAFQGRRLCETGTRLAEETTTQDELRASGERVHQVIASAQFLRTPYDSQESLHPNYLGQLALRDCLRQALADGAPVSGSCQAPSDWSQVGVDGGPVMRFTPRS